MRALDEHLTIVSEAEKSALYALPDFDDFQRAEYFALTAEELALAATRRAAPENLVHFADRPSSLSGWQTYPEKILRF